jgi:hypothetical protein
VNQITKCQDFNRTKMSGKREITLWKRGGRSGSRRKKGWVGVAGGDACPCSIHLNIIQTMTPWPMSPWYWSMHATLPLDAIHINNVGLAVHFGNYHDVEVRAPCNRTMAPWGRAPRKRAILRKKIKSFLFWADFFSKKGHFYLFYLHRHTHELAGVKYTKLHQVTKFCNLPMLFFSLYRSQIHIFKF